MKEKKIKIKTNQRVWENKQIIKVLLPTFFLSKRIPAIFFETNSRVSPSHAVMLYIIFVSFHYPLHLLV